MYGNIVFFSFTNELFESKLEKNGPLSNLCFWCGFEIQDACSCCTQFNNGAYWRETFSLRMHYTTVHEFLDFHSLAGPKGQCFGYWYNFSSISVIIR